MHERTQEALATNLKVISSRRLHIHVYGGGFLDFIVLINGMVWSPVLIFAFMLCALYFSVKTGFFQFAKAPIWLKSTLFSLFKKDKNKDEKELSAFQAVCTALGASIGTGNIVGVATAITMGGAGAVFWMIFSSFFSMMLIYAENYLGGLFKYRDKNGRLINGAYAYMEKALHSRNLGVLYAVLMVLTSFGMGNMAQSNSMAEALNTGFGIAPAVTGTAAALFVGIAIFGGVKRIARISTALVPFMGILYIAGGTAVIIANLSNLPQTVKYIFSDALSFKSAASGAAGYGIMRSMRYGISRGVFTNEAGIGTSVPLLGAGSDSPKKQGMWGIFQVFADTTVICTITALAILTSGACNIYPGLTGAALSARAFESVFGRSGNLFIAVSITLFALATLLSWSVLGIKGTEYIFKKDVSFTYIVIFLIFIIVGSLNKSETVFELSDIINGLMAVINIIVLFLLRRKVETKQ